MVAAPGPLDPPDDPAIADGCLLLRRISPSFIVPDGAGGRRVSSAAFQAQTGPYGDGVSVYVRDWLETRGLDDSAVLIGHPDHGLAILEVTYVRSIGLGVVGRPDPDDGLRGEAHAEVVGTNSKSTQRKLAKASVIQLWPPGGTASSA